jgi:hypothetical protein
MDMPSPCALSFPWLRMFSSQTFSHINTPTVSSLLFYLLTPPVKMEQTQYSKMSAYSFRCWGITQKKQYNIIGYGLFLCGAGQDHEVICCEWGNEPLIFIKGGQSLD